MASSTKNSLSVEAWMAFHRIRTTLLPPLIKHLSEKCGLTEAEYQVFIGLKSAEGQKLKPTQLADALGWDLARLSHQISRMEARGLLTRQQCPLDARSCLIGLTKKGQAAIDAAFPLQMEQVDQLFSQALTAQQMKSLIEISEAIQSNLERHRSASTSAQQ